MSMRKKKKLTQYQREKRLIEKQLKALYGLAWFPMTTAETYSVFDRIKANAQFLGMDIIGGLKNGWKVKKIKKSKFKLVA
jgi:hypothetical protein